MTDLKIPNLNKKSEKFLFKKKLSLRRKSKTKLLKEASIMLFFSIFLIYLNYIIPNKTSIFDDLFNNCGKLIKNIFGSLSYSYEIFLAVYIVVSFIISFILLLGVFTRLIKIVKRKSRRISFK